MDTPTKLVLVIGLLGVCAVAGGGAYAWNQHGATDSLKGLLLHAAQPTGSERRSETPVAPAPTEPSIAAVDTASLEPMAYTPYEQGWHILHTQQVWSHSFTSTGEGRMRFQLQSEAGAPFDFYLVRPSEYAAAVRVTNGYSRLEPDAIRAPLVRRTGQRRLELLEQTVPAGDWVALVVNAASPAATIKVYAKFSQGEPIQAEPQRPRRIRDAREPRRTPQVASGAAPRTTGQPDQTRSAAVEVPARKWVDPSTIPTGLASQECPIRRAAKADKDKKESGDPTWMSASAPINP